ncbi:DNA polymerase I [Acetitomaculum ruminis DSM 5522]|uniref:DNA polymerase I n=1 Tax=Acetitomaculum ruminis DSM 5522 TaxID=1120918 RepID=A0A1I0XSI0_9FIRM|nr:DNA polymerase I [Acetitomaculum ruminis]SFB03396.1 DNA polymerase I [Acetitomaculum ruminis DSM 5522]
MKEKIVLIDGHSILNRAFYGIPALTNSKGIYTNGVYGFLNIMFKLIDEENPQYLAVAFDTSKPTFRHEMFKEYKGTRKPTPKELSSQVPLIKEVLSAMNIFIISKAGLEADDLIGTMAEYSRNKGLDVVIISGDRDLLQLVKDDVKLRIPKTTRNGTTVENYYPDDVIEKYQLKPAQIIDLKSLMGDSADNIPGIPGVGEKTATKILLEYETLEKAYENVDNLKPPKASKSLKENYDLAVLSKKLATINTKADIEFDIENAKLGSMFNENSKEKFVELEFKNLLSRFSFEDEKEKIERKFEHIVTLKALDEFLNEAKKAKEIGTGMAYEKKLYGFSIAFDERNAFIEVNDEIKEDELCEKIKELIIASKSASFMDLKGILKVINLEKFENKYLDLSIGAYLINPIGGSYSYEDLAGIYLNESLESPKELLLKNSIEKTFKEDKKRVLTLTCYQAMTALLAKNIIFEKLKEMEMSDLYFNMEGPLIFVLDAMEKEGMLVKREALKEYGDSLVGRINQLEKSIYEKAGEEFNINSPKQLGVILFEKLQMPNAKKTKTGYSTSADILEKLAGEYPIVNEILEYRTLAKLKSTYADGLANYIGKDERIHSNFNQTITATGRISSTEPNLQNIPIKLELGRLIRKVFVPKDGFIFLDADYSQIELRVLAHMSGDETLIDAYRNSKDIHKATAASVFNIPIEEVTPLQRRNAKAVNFGIIYGMSAFGLGQDLGISNKEAADYIEKYYNAYPKIKMFLDGLVASAREKGYSITMFNRRRPMPELKASNFMQRSFGERTAKNSPIQGSAADIIKIAMIEVYEELKKRNLKSKLILSVHDELLVETALEEVEEVKKILTEKMMGAAKLQVPLEIELETGTNWYEAK